LTQLVGLDLSQNRIRELPFPTDLQALEELNLSSDFITDLQALEGLDLSSNFISDPEPLAELTQLDWLDLTSNPVFNWAGVLGGLPSVGNPSDAYELEIVNLHLAGSPTWLRFDGILTDIYTQHRTLFDEALYHASAAYPLLRLLPGDILPADVNANVDNDGADVNADVNNDGVVNIQDLVLVASKFGEADPNDVEGF
jgi:hypothetical protein